MADGKPLRPRHIAINFVGSVKTKDDVSRALTELKWKWKFLTDRGRKKREDKELKGLVIVVYAATGISDDDIAGKVHSLVNVVRFPDDGIDGHRDDKD